MLRAIFNPKVNLVLSTLMFVTGIALCVLNWPFGVIGQGEPRLIYQMSGAALWIAGYGNLLVSMVHKEGREDD